MDKSLTCIIHGDIKDKLNDLSAAVNDIIEENEELRETLRTYNKDEEIQSLKDELDSVYKRSICVLSEREKDSLYKFRNKHYTDCRNFGEFTFDLLYSGIGHCVKVKCPICGEEEDITDMSCW